MMVPGRDALELGVSGAAAPARGRGAPGATALARGRGAAAPNPPPARATISKKPQYHTARHVGQPCACNHCELLGLSCPNEVTNKTHGKRCSVCHGRKRRSSKAKCRPQQVAGREQAGPVRALEGAGPGAGRSLEIVCWDGAAAATDLPAAAATDLLMRTVNHVAVAAAASAAAHVGRAWSATLSGASNRLQRKTPSVAGVVIYTEGRNGQDRSLAATLQRLSAFLPTISFASLAGFNGVGRRIGNEPVNEAEDLRNVSVVLDAVTGALQQLDVETFHAGAHVFEDWAMDEDAYMHAAPQRFCEEDVEEEKAHYTKSIAAGMLGCTTSHFLAWASFAQQGLSPYDSADCVSTVTPLRLLG